MAKKMVAFRFEPDFIEESKKKAKKRKETLTDYIIYCVSEFNQKSK